MKFKIDENLPVEFAEILVKSGYDALTVNDQNLAGEADEILIEICKKEHRILITLDLDFTNILKYIPEKYEGIIVLRSVHQDKNTLLTILKKFIPVLKKENFKKRLCILEQTKYRMFSKQ